MHARRALWTGRVALGNNITGTMVRGGLPYHVLAGAPTKSKKERYLLRTGATPGKSGKKERAIILMQEEKKRKLQGDDSSGAGTSSESAASAASSSSTTEQESGSSAAEQSLHRRYKAQEQEKEERAAAEKNVVTPRALSILESMRAEMKKK